MAAGSSSNPLDYLGPDPLGPYAQFDGIPPLWGPGGLIPGTGNLPYYPWPQGSTPGGATPTDAQKYDWWRKVLGLPPGGIGGIINGAASGAASSAAAGAGSGFAQGIGSLLGPNWKASFFVGAAGLVLVVVGAVAIFLEVR